MIYDPENWMRLSLKNVAPPPTRYVMSNISNFLLGWKCAAEKFSNGLVNTKQLKFNTSLSKTEDKTFSKIYIYIKFFNLPKTFRILVNNKKKKCMPSCNT